MKHVSLSPMQSSQFYPNGWIVKYIVYVMYILFSFFFPKIQKFTNIGYRTKCKNLFFLQIHELALQSYETNTFNVHYSVYMIVEKSY